MQWRYLAQISARPVLDVNGGSAFALHYDPKIAEPIRDSVPLDVDLWPVWGAINVPVMAVRGESSDLLLPETFERMQAEGAEVLTVANAGHAPALMDEPTIAAIEAFLVE
jgi:pimeloyl-ACP methyl ester carboxylesterase